MVRLWPIALLARIAACLDDSLQYPMFFLGELILFPNETLPLQIFEPRYQLLVARCLGDVEFARSLSGSLYVGDADPCRFGITFETFGPGARGVLATIDRSAISERDDADSPMIAYRIVVTGGARFAIASESGFSERVETDDGDQPPLVHANVSAYDDSPDPERGDAGPPRWEQIQRRLKWLFGAEARNSLVGFAEANVPATPLSHRAFFLASQLPLDHARRCELLALTSGVERWIRIADLLGEWLERAKEERQWREGRE